MQPYRLFEVYGIEIEYMVIDRKSREVRSLVDVLLDALNALPENEATKAVEWSHELVAHVAEAKCRQPLPSIAALHAPLKISLATVNTLLGTLDACLLPSAAHPWMNPDQDAMLWPHEDHEIYAEYDRIFGCNTHGWTNLQSVHLNLPFGNADEFGRLHAAIRLALPLIPALAAASPYLDGRFTGLLDARMEHYRHNSSRIPSMTGPLIPEPVFTPQAYQTEILDRIYAESAPFDQLGILHDEWANARGAIARFDRNAIEIRVTDSQECPTADLAVSFAIAELVRLLTSEQLISWEDQKKWETSRLYALFFDAVAQAEQAPIRDAEYAAIFGLKGAHIFGDIWDKVLDLPSLQHPLFNPFYRHYRKHGSLARRMLARAGENPERRDLEKIVDALCHCLREDSFFV